MEYLPSSKLKQARATVRLGTQTAKELVKSKSETLLNGDNEGVKDIMTLLREYMIRLRGDYL